MSIAVQVNGATVQLDGQQSLLSALAAYDIDESTGGVAVAVDGDVIPRGEWSSTVLQGGEQVEIVRAVQGG